MQKKALFMMLVFIAATSLTVPVHGSVAQDVAVTVGVTTGIGIGVAAGAEYFSQKIAKDPKLAALSGGASAFAASIPYYLLQDNSFGGWISQWPISLAAAAGVGALKARFFDPNYSTGKSLEANEKKTNTKLLIGGALGGALVAGLGLAAAYVVSNFIIGKSVAPTAITK